MQKGNWLYQHRKNVTSQNGEDGVIEKIFNKIGILNKWCVDVGAGDGRTISNTWHWINNEKWSAVCIECSSRFFPKLKETYSDRDDVFTFHEFVSEENNIDKILKKTPIPKEFDLLSIDIDSFDYKLWEICEEYRPRVVIIEANPSISPDIELIQIDPTLSIGSSALAMVKLATKKGYQLAAHLVANCIFVSNECFDKLNIQDNSLESLFTSPFVPRVVCDTKGVHYLLKEGPWGYRRLNLANELVDQIRLIEDGYLSALRSLQQLNPPNIISTNKNGEIGFIAHIHYDWDIQTILQDFRDRMSEIEIETRPSRRKAIFIRSIIERFFPVIVKWYRKIRRLHI